MDMIWAWGVLGLILLGLEMATGTFYILWFGVAGLLVAGLTWLAPSMSLTLQVFLFAVLSLGSLLIWKQFYKKDEVDLRVGQSQGDEIGRLGTITEAVSAKQNGKIKFAQGVMGSREWAAIATEDLEVGAEAVIVAIEGNALRVTRKTA